MSLATEEYYKKFLELQEKLRKSEEHRLLLEMKFNEMMQNARDEEQKYYKKISARYKDFLKQDKKRQERNEQILRNLERIETRIGMLSAKTERVNLLRNQYQRFLQRTSTKKLEFPKNPKIERKLKNYDLTYKDSGVVLETDSNQAKYDSEDEDSEDLEEYIKRLAMKKRQKKKDAEKLKYSDFDNNNNNDSKVEIANETVGDKTFSSQYGLFDRLAAGADNINQTNGSLLNDANKVEHNKIIDMPSHEQIISDYLLAKSNLESSIANVTDSGIINVNKNDNEELIADKEQCSFDKNTEAPIQHNHFADEIRSENIYENNETVLGNDQFFIKNNQKKENIFEIKEQVKATVNLDKNFERNEKILQQNENKNIDFLKSSNEILGLDKDDLNINPKKLDSTDLTQVHEIDQLSQNIVSKDSEKIRNKNQEINNDIQYKTHEMQNGIPEVVNIEPNYSNENSKPNYEQDEQILCENQKEIDELKQYSNNNDLSKPNYDENGQQIFYDQHGQPIQYDENGQPIQEYDENGQPLYFDGNGQRIQYDESGYQIQYDENGQQIQYDGNGQAIQYDEHGQAIYYQQENLQYDQNGQALAFGQYDETGQSVQNYDQNSWQQYDENGQVVNQYHDGEGVVEYDENGQAVQKLDENWQEYDDQNPQDIQENNQSYQNETVDQNFQETNKTMDNYEIDNDNDELDANQIKKDLQETIEQDVQPNSEKFQNEDENPDQKLKDDNLDKDFEDSSSKLTKNEPNEILEAKIDENQPDKAEPLKVLEMLDTDTESLKQDQTKITDSDFDFSNG